MADFNDGSLAAAAAAFGKLNEEPAEDIEDNDIEADPIDNDQVEEDIDDEPSEEDNGDDTGDEPVETSEEQDEPAAPAIEAPASWDADAKKVFATL